MNLIKWSDTARYSAQSAILKQALVSPQHSMDELLRLMRQTGEASVYLAGSRLDNDFCLGSGDVGMLISVQPEDAPKAAEPGYHPDSAEVYVTFQGELVMECLEDGQVRARPVGGNQPLVLPAGQCHRVRYDAERKAASLIVKTNVRSKPGVLRCDTCTYYRDKAACPLHQSWKAEMTERSGAAS